MRTLHLDCNCAESALKQAPPKCEAKIDCAVFIDNGINDVYVDGKQVKVTCTPRRYIYWGDQQCAFSFPSSAKTLVSERDHECCGQATLHFFGLRAHATSMQNYD